MSTTDPRLHRIRCSAKSLCQTRNSCTHKELQSHGVEDGLDRAVRKARPPAGKMGLLLSFGASFTAFPAFVEFR